MARKPTYSKNLLESIEQNDYFKSEVLRLSQKATIYKSDLEKLKKGLEDLGFPRLSSFYDDLLFVKFKNPKLNLSTIVAGATSIEKKKDSYGRDYFELRVYPETTKTDLCRAYDKLQLRNGNWLKGMDYHKIGAEIQCLKLKGISHKEICSILNQRGYNFSYQDTTRILWRYRKKIKNT